MLMLMQEDIKQWTMENEERKKRFQEKQEEEKGSSLHRNPVRLIPYYPHI